MNKTWWKTDVTKVISETDILYDRIVAIDPKKTKIAVTKTKIIEARGWMSTQRLWGTNFDKVIKQLGFFYVPKQLVPGPAFIFPIHDINGEVVRAQTKPQEGSVLYSNKSKYHYIGEKPIGPSWLGNDHITLQQIINLRKVTVVEGPFDLLASRLLCPDIPILSPLTKRMGFHHIVYLRMLGVRQIFLLYDNEEASIRNNIRQKDGAGNMSMEQQAASIRAMNIDITATIVTCPKSDPSFCLTDTLYAEKLRSRISNEF